MDVNQQEERVQKVKIAELFLYQKGYSEYISMKIKNQKESRSIRWINTRQAQGNFDQLTFQENGATAEPWRTKMITILTNIWFNGALDLINLSFTFLLFQFDQHLWFSTGTDLAILIIALILQAVFFVEMLANFICIGPSKLWQTRKIMYFELLLQIALALQAIIDSTILKSKYESTSGVVPKEIYDLGIVFIFRNFRLIHHFYVIKDAKLVADTIQYLTKPILSKLFFIYLIFYIYAYIGIVAYSG